MYATHKSPTAAMNIVSVPGVPSDRSEMEQTLDLLANEMASLDACVDHLINRLAPVIRAIPSAVPLKQESSSAGSPFGMAVSTQAERARSIRERLDVVLAALAV